MTFLLDNNALSYFFNASEQGAPSDASHKVSLAVVGEVADELRKHPTFGAKFDNWLAKTAIRERAIAVGSAADAVLQELHPASAPKDLGEHASIALAATDLQYVFVANDKGALWLALNELVEPGERIVGLRVFLRRLREHAKLPGRAIDGVVRAAQGKHPTWWAAWVAQAATSTATPRS